MARTPLTLGILSRDGIAVTPVAANADGNSFDNRSQDVVLLVASASGSAVTVTIDIPKTLDGVAVQDLSFSVAPGYTMILGPFPKELYNQAGDVVHVNYSGVTGVTVAAYRLLK